MNENHAARAQRAFRNNDYTGALDHARASLAAGEADAHRVLAIVLPGVNHRLEALTHARLATLERAANAMDFARLGALLQASGDSVEAVTQFRRAVDLDPNSAVFWNELGLALSDDNLDDAERALRKAVALAPDIAEIHNNLGGLLKEKGATQAALACYEAALERKPDYWEALGNLGVVNQILGRADAAIDCFDRLLRKRPNEARYWTYYGAALAMKGRLESAESAHRKALALDPELSDAHNNLAIVLKDQGNLTAAREAYKRVIALSPDDSGAFSNFLMCLCYDRTVNAAEMVQAHQAWAKRYTPNLLEAFEGVAYDPDKILSIGYVSPDFRSHSVARFLDCVFAAHDRSKFRLLCYSDVSAPDDTTALIRSRVDVWRNVVGLDDNQLHAQILRDGVDILVDLAGHTANNRLRVFARRAAPVQITWLGYGATTGVEAMDYVLSDEWTDPTGVSSAWFTEEILRSPAGFMCFTPLEAPLSFKDEPRSPTFGSFNNLSKINSEVVALWAKVLLAAPGSRLVLKSRQLDDTQTTVRLRAEFSEQGVASDRLTLLGRMASSEDHLALYGDIDVALDPFPYNGATTTCEALWMGVPVVSLVGEQHVSRFGAGFLHRAGYPEWAVTTEDAYVNMATGLLSTRPRREAIRSKVSLSSLMDSAQFTQALGQLYRDVWRRRCAVADAGSPEKSR